MIKPRILPELIKVRMSDVRPGCFVYTSRGGFVKTMGMCISSFETVGQKWELRLLIMGTLVTRRGVANEDAWVVSQ